MFVLCGDDKLKFKKEETMWNKLFKAKSKFFNKKNKKFVIKNVTLNEEEISCAADDSKNNRLSPQNIFGIFLFNYFILFI